jgi:transglutaminase-like putative cysteine protease/tetratricopeptide (TPR) repeat protein
MARSLDIIRSWRGAVWLAAASLLIPTAPRADEATAETAHFSLTPEALYKAASAVQTPAGTRVSVLEVHESYRFAADGSDIYTQYMVYKILSPAGAESWNEVSMDWSPWRDGKPEFKARVVTPDGKTYTLDPATIADSPARDSDSTVYGDERTLRAPLPAIAPGAVVETEVVMKDGLPFPGAGKVGRSVFQDRDPVQHMRLTLEAPKALPLRYRMDLLPGLQPVRSETADTVRWVFDAGPMPAQGDIDPGLPGDLYARPAVTFSSGESWNALAQAYAPIVDKQIAAANVRDLVARLIKGRNTDAQKAGAIVEFLNREIRYTGIEFDQSSVIPHSPTETLARKYGDCKDKSTLLVAMLRAAGLPANLALLNAGSRLDVPGDVSGMGLFDHAIVYMPGSPEIWIDATDSDARLGQLPDDDRGRSALIIASESTTLTTIPEASSKDNVDLEEREIYLSDQGPARVVEISRPQGAYESTYRGLYADLAERKTKEDLTDYFKDEYDAAGVDRMERTDPRDFSQPFRLTLEGKRAKFGTTTLTDAKAYINIDGLFAGLPKALKTREPTAEENAKATHPQSPRTTDYLINRPYVAEWHYKIVPPAGFVPLPPPADLQLSIGPAQLSETFTTTSDGSVQAVVRFDSVKRRFSVAEQAVMRARIADLMAADLTVVKFDLRAHSLLTQGHASESFQAYRDLVALHPRDPIQHLRRANALLEAGMGDAARTEARLAVRLDPTSAYAQRRLANTLEHDLVGRWFGPGADYLGARAAYKTATSLDPQDTRLAADYAVLLEYGDHGVRYGPGADLQGALAVYGKLTSKQLAEYRMAMNPAFDLLYTRQFAAAKDSATAANSPSNGLIVACVAQLNGVAQAMEEAHRRSDTDTSYKQILASAGQILMNLREYANAAQLLEAGASGANAAQTMGLATTLRSTRRYEEVTFADKPEDFVLHFMTEALNGALTPGQAIALESHNARLVDDETYAETDRAALLAAANQVRSAAVRSNIAPRAMTDIALRMMRFSSSGNDSTGYRETLQAPGQANEDFIIVRENGRYLMLESSERQAALGLEVIERVGHDDLHGAAVLLDWARDMTTRKSGDTSSSETTLSHFWSPQQANPDKHRIMLAAAALLVSSAHTAQQGVALLEAARNDGSTTAEEVQGIDLALLDGYDLTRNYGQALTVAEGLEQRTPQSRSAFIAQSRNLELLNRLEEADDLARKRLASNPEDIDAQRALRGDATIAHDYAKAYDAALKVVANGHSVAADLNDAAWLSLFFDRPGGPDIDTAVRAVQLSNNAPAILHTLACVYAEAGKTKEAREVLLQAMEATALEEPTGNYWYAFGRIAEQYGERAIALADYAKVTAPQNPLQDPDSTYRLAQRRIALLKTSGTGHQHGAGTAD